MKLLYLLRFYPASLHKLGYINEVFTSIIKLVINWNYHTAALSYSWSRVWLIIRLIGLCHRGMLIKTRDSSFCLGLKVFTVKYGVDSSGAASEGGKCSTAGCFAKHHALNCGWNNFWAQGKQAEKKQETPHKSWRVTSSLPPLKVSVEFHTADRELIKTEWSLMSPDLSLKRKLVYLSIEPKYSHWKDDAKPYRPGLFLLAF